MLERVVLGTMEFGRALSENHAKMMLSRFSSLGFSEIDTASLYSNGETEKIIGRIGTLFKEMPMKVATKVNPSWKERGFSNGGLREQFLESLHHLRLESVDMLYIHWPSKNDPLEDTLSQLNQLHREGKFERLALSNFSAWQVMKVWSLCEKNGWLKPSVYQGMYNMLTRDVEAELIPCLRDLGMSFYAYNPLAGGILTGRYTFDSLKEFNDNTLPNRFYGIGGKWAKSYQDRFWKPGYFHALEDIKKEMHTTCGDKLGRSSPQPDLSHSTADHQLLRLSFSWILNHSALSDRFGDALVIGASSMNQFESNMKIIQNERMNIPQSLLERIDSAYSDHIKGCCPKYFR